MSRNLKISALFLSAFYLAISIGFGIRAHYCHDDLSSLSYASLDLDCCCGDEAGDITCCSTIEEYFQFKEELIVPEENPFDSNHLFLQEGSITIDLNEPGLIWPKSNSYEVIDNGPPRYLKHTSLILYA